MAIANDIFSLINDLTCKESLLLLLILGLVLFFFQFLYGLGLFYSPKIQTQTLPQSTILYLNVEGKDDDFYNVFKTIEVQTKKHFKISKQFGFYHDDPSQAKNNSNCRASLGIIVNDGEIKKIDDFLRQFPQYKRTSFRRTQCYSVQYPFYNSLSYVMVGSRVYPKLRSFIKSEEAQTDSLWIEIYHFLSQNGKTIEVLSPTQNFEAFEIWKKEE